MHDILMEGCVDEEELAQNRLPRNLTEYEKARIRYLGETKGGKKSFRSSLSSH